MDAARDDVQQQLAGADVDKSDYLSSLFDDVASLVLPLLPLDERARAACVRKAWCAEATTSALLAELNFERCSVGVTDVTLAALCARSGPALRSLRLDVTACKRVTGAGLVAALRDGGCAGLRHIKFDERTRAYGETLTSAMVNQLVVACPHVEHTAFVVECHCFAEAAQAAAALPGPLQLAINDADVSGLTESVVSGLLLRSVDLLDIYGCDFSPAATTALATALRVNATLEVLRLSGNRGIDDGGIAALAEALCVNSTLTVFESSCTIGFGLRGLAAFVEVLRVNSTLEQLELAYTNMRSRGAVALSKALQANSTLTTLDFSCNDIGNAGAAALGMALRVNRSLKHVDFSGNCIGSAGAVALWEALRVNNTLTLLNLENNDIGDDGMDVLGEALRNNHTLASLDLSGNDIHDDGAAALIEALGTTNTLTELRVFGNAIGAASAAALAEALRSELRACSAA